MLVGIELEIGKPLISVCIEKGYITEIMNQYL